MIVFLRAYEGIETAGVKYRRRQTARLAAHHEVALVERGVAEVVVASTKKKKAKAKAEEAPPVPNHESGGGAAGPAAS